MRNFGFGDPSTREVTSDSGHAIDLLRVAASPSDGFVSFATIGLFAAPLRVGRREFPLRLEFVAMGRDGDEWVGSMLCSAAFELARRRALVAPGSVLRNIVNPADASSGLCHAYLTAPRAWANRFGTVAYRSFEVYFLQVIPISRAEADFVEAGGFAAFEKALANNRHDLTDPRRADLIK